MSVKNPAEISIPRIMMVGTSASIKMADHIVSCSLQNLEPHWIESIKMQKNFKDNIIFNQPVLGFDYQTLQCKS